MCGGQQKVEWECEKFSKKWGSIVRGSVGRRQECEVVSRKWSRSVRISAISGAVV